MDWPEESIKHFKAGDHVVEEGDLGSEMYVILKGVLQVVKHGSSGDKVLAILTEGDFFGEMAILEGRPRTARVDVMEDAQLLEITSAKAEEMLAREPEIALRMLKKMSERLREADRQIETLLHDSDPSRLVHTIMSLVYMHGKDLDGQWVLDRSLDGKQLAALAGVSERAAQKVVDDLKKNRLVDFLPDRTIINNREGLENFLEYLKWRSMAFAP